ncbi:single-stranded DNA-binding protein [Streptosporangium sp. NPDC051023]|uniref:single-stranded DNA-binding protein n=1 Tax=Streptosporangium sp. NPDC051023 TaxID=3155410 RepID=UPI00344DC3E2
MAIGDTTITIVGNLVDDPELKFSEKGTAIAAFTVASTRRVFDKANGKMTDGDTMFMRCSAFRELAEHIAESASKGTRVLVTGRLQQRSYEDKQGVKRWVMEVIVEDAGVSLKFATAKVNRVTREKVPHPAESWDNTSASWNGENQERQELAMAGAGAGFGGQEAPF